MTNEVLAQRLNGGRPSSFSVELFEELLLWVGSGRTVSAFCVEHLVARRTVYNWLRDPEAKAQLARARDLGCEAIEDEMLRIADEGGEDDVQHRKLRLWMREKLLTWHNPARYGQKREVKHSGAVEHRVELSDQERQIRIQKILAGARKAPQLDVEISDPLDGETAG